MHFSGLRVYRVLASGPVAARLPALLACVSRVMENEGSISLLSFDLRTPQSRPGIGGMDPRDPVIDPPRPVPKHLHQDPDQASQDHEQH